MKRKSSYVKKGSVNTIHIAVYGTLKRCERANYMLDYPPDGFKGSFKLNGYKLFTNSEKAAFPYCTPAEGYSMQVEVYACPRRVLKDLDLYEGYREDGNGLYDRKLVKVEGFDTECYLYFVKSSDFAKIEAKPNRTYSWTSAGQLEDVSYVYDC